MVYCPLPVCQTEMCIRDRFQTISGVGVLPAFSPEKVIIKSAKKQIETEDVYIAVCQEKITSDGFKALLNPDLFSQGKEIVMGRKC